MIATDPSLFFEINQCWETKNLTDLSEADASPLADLGDHAHCRQHVRLAQQARKTSPSQVAGRFPVRPPTVPPGTTGRVFSFLATLAASLFCLLLPVVLLGCAPLQTSLIEKKKGENWMHSQRISISPYVGQDSC